MFLQMTAYIHGFMPALKSSRIQPALKIVKSPISKEVPRHCTIIENVTTTTTTTTTTKEKEHQKLFACGTLAKMLSCN